MQLQDLVLRSLLLLLHHARLRLLLWVPSGDAVCASGADPARLSDFLPVILSGGGYDTKTSLLLSAPPYVVAGVYTAAMAYLSDKTRKRALFIAVSATVCLTGLFIMAYAGPLGVRYVRCSCSLWLAHVAAFGNAELTRAHPLRSSVPSSPSRAPSPTCTSHFCMHTTQRAQSPLRRRR